MKKNNVKEKIVDATIALIGKSASIESVTIRDIAAKAGVGVGLINYHFQTKENLINQCVQKIIGNKATCTFLAQNQGISRISILSDLFAGNASDNTSQTIEAYLPVIKEIWGDSKSEEEIFLSTHILIATLQSAFLRRNVFMQSTKIDFYDTEQRERLIDIIIDTIFK
ncbi:MAG: TetR/AcrR family transcriptional regulator [Clostridia bacterium]|nr:TetR/AcrR family transcriptional regulator [Clostridia bacterium]